MWLEDVNFCLVKIFLVYLMYFILKGKLFKDVSDWIGWIEIKVNENKMVENIRICMREYVFDKKDSFS